MMYQCHDKEIAECEFGWFREAFQDQPVSQVGAGPSQRIQGKTMYSFLHLVNHTAIKFVSDQLFLASCSSAPRIHLWDMEGKLCQKYLY